MKTSLILLSFLASALGKNNCPIETAPVCASDGSTYLNKCVVSILARERPGGLSVVHEGRCHPCTCKNEHMYAVCASDGISYKDPCQMLCNDPKKNLTMEFPGYCKCKCDSYNYEPVCGSDGQTYGNKCLFDCVSIANEVTMIKEGKC